jgi:UDP-2,3-diacylglucosamine pyrophosphatase LpxH
MADLANILVVSDLHFGEELLPGATSERRHAVELGARAFREFLRYHASRRLGGRPWRLVIAGDLFDFMSVFVPPSRDLPARTADERRFGLDRGTRAGVARMKAICENHRELLADMVRFAASGHRIDIIVGNHDLELLEPDVVTELHRQLRLAAATDRLGVTDPAASALAPERWAPRIEVVPWFVYEPGVAWIEHGHVYDEGCSAEFNLAPTDASGRLIANADYAATRYLAMAVPEIDPHGTEEWSLWGYMRYGWDIGIRDFGALWAAYARFSAALVKSHVALKSYKHRDQRRRRHRERLHRIADETGVPAETLSAIDRLARTPMTKSFRRLGRMLMLDRFSTILGSVIALLALWIFAPLLWAFLGTLVVVGGAAALHGWLGKHLVTSQLPMRAVPQRIKKLVDAPVVVFGHTHDPRWQPLRSGGLYLNCGTWLPATRPGLRRSFTHALIQPRPGALPLVELRQWRDGVSQPFDAGADLGAGVTSPGIPTDAMDWMKAV